MVKKKAPSDKKASEADETRRDFIVLAASDTAAIGGVSAMWPFVDSLNPASDVLALSSTEVSLSGIESGQIITVMWRGKPVFIRRRTEEEIKAASEVPLDDLPDPEDDRKRTKKGKREWLVLIGICTHLGCIPLGHRGDYDGWFCPCHGSQYDTSGRIRKGPAPKNLAIPQYEFIKDDVIKIG